MISAAHSCLVLFFSERFYLPLLFFLTATLGNERCLSS